MVTEPSGLALIPAVVTIMIAIVSRRPVESLLAGVIAGLLLLGPGEALTNFSAILLEVMMSETIAWVIIVCGLMGSLIAILMKAGAATAFSHALAGKAKNAGSALLYTWGLGLIIFIDDYLNALAVGSAMRKVTDKFRVSREMLAYVVDSTAAPMCVLVPVSTWAVFFSGLFEASNYAEPGQGMALFISSIPYMLYAWISVLIVPLVATGIIPALGPMKAAQAKAVALDNNADPQDIAADQKAGGKVGIYHFLLPIFTLLGVSLWFDLDVQIGVIVAVATTILLYGFQRILAWGELFDGVVEGIQAMVPALTIVVIAFVFSEINDRLGLAVFIIENVTPYMTPTLFPLVVFVTMGFVSFATGSSWGVFAIAVPIVLPFADSVGVDMPLAIGALVSASVFGSHACFYSDATVLTAQGSGCGVVEHAVTQFPYALISAVLAAVGLTAVAAL